MIQRYGDASPRVDRLKPPAWPQGMLNKPVSESGLALTQLSSEWISTPQFAEAGSTSAVQLVFLVVVQISLFVISPLRTPLIASRNGHPQMARWVRGMRCTTRFRCAILITSGLITTLL